MGHERAKRNAAARAVEWVRDGMTVGLGTGSTAELFLEALAGSIGPDLSVRGIPTSEATAQRARVLGIPLVSFDEVEHCDLLVDGADEIDPHGSAIKGGGGALLREKIVATATRGPRVAVVDARKRVERLGAFPLPVEVLPFARRPVERRIRDMGVAVTWRTRDGAPVVTDNGNHLLDCEFGARDEWPQIATQLNNIPGLMGHGLFWQVFTVIVTGEEDGAAVYEVKRSGAPI